MNQYLYNGYIKTLSERFEAELSTILAGYNFDYGDEFEVALCKILRQVLPEKYGICRGYIVDSAGNQAGDDIIIYEQIRFPTMGLRNKNDYSRKEFIPVEAVYCYIEAKHSINFSETSEQSLSKAISQVANAKNLSLGRESVSPSQITPHHTLTLGGGISSRSPENYPNIQNPFFSVVVARQVKDSTGEVLSGEVIKEKLFEAEIQIPADKSPDLLVLGKDVVVLPFVPKDGLLYLSPFFLPNTSRLAAKIANDVAFGVALASIMWAVDWIQLGNIRWKDIITDALSIPYRDKRINDNSSSQE